MKMKAALLAACLIGQNAAADDIGEFLASSGVAAAALGFGLNISPNNSEDVWKNNAIGLTSLAACTWLSNKWVSLPNDTEVIKKAPEVLLPAIALVYAVSSVAARGCNKLATSNLQKTHECPCGVIFEAKDKADFTKHLVDHGFRFDSCSIEAATEVEPEAATLIEE